MDAVRLTLANDPNVAIDAARVDSARGALQIASGRFDPVVVLGADADQRQGAAFPLLQPGDPDPAGHPGDQPGAPRRSDPRAAIPARP